MIQSNIVSYARGLAAAAILSVSAFAGGHAEASTLTPNGTYDATSVTTGGNLHSVWLVDFLGSGADRYWQFEGGAGELVVTDTSATLSGTLVQNSNSDNKLDIVAEFGFRGTGPAGHTAAGLKCGGGCGDAANWDFFDFVSGSLTGASTSLAGLSVSLMGQINANGDEYPVQLGNGANDKNAGLGLSSWFRWYSDGDDTFFDGRARGRGDINVNLAPVPLPASGLLLIGAIGAVGAASRRRRKS